MLEFASILAVWRLTHLLVEEDGPFDIFYRLRRYVIGHISKTFMHCPYCVSMWVAVPFAFLFPYTIIAWLALSAGAILVEVIHERLTE